MYERVLTDSKSGNEIIWKRMKPSKSSTNLRNTGVNISASKSEVSVNQ